MKISQILKDFVSRRDLVKVLATANADGSPNIGPNASTHVFDDAPAQAERGNPGYRELLIAPLGNNLLGTCAKSAQLLGWRFYECTS
jgi:hypothetical protein